jgi:hypothetical protein
VPWLAWRDRPDGPARLVERLRFAETGELLAENRVKGERRGLGTTCSASRSAHV